jgi:hypothetical protein
MKFGYGETRMPTKTDYLLALLVLPVLAVGFYCLVWAIAFLDYAFGPVMWR